MPTEHGMIGALSGRPLRTPDVDVARFDAGTVVNGRRDTRFDPSLQATARHPDNRSFRRRFGLLLPATNTILEHELWSLLVTNGEAAGIDGVGLHSTPVITPKPDISTPEGVDEFRTAFLGGLAAAVQTALLARPQYLVMGISLEHILLGLAQIRETMDSVEQLSGLSCATWHDAVQAALAALGATRIGRLKSRTGVPIVAINPATLWYALRENGFSQPLHGAGRLLREF